MAPLRRQLVNPHPACWKRFIKGKYLQKRRRDNRCPSCNSARDCNNRYCLHCMVGGLCPREFKPHHEHYGHPSLQVRISTYKYAVREADVAQFMVFDSTYIQKYTVNGMKGFMLRKRDPARQGCRIRRFYRQNCYGCRVSIPNSEPLQQGRDFLVCSLECLMMVAELRPELKLIKMKDGTQFVDIFTPEEFNAVKKFIIPEE